MDDNDRRRFNNDENDYYTNNSRRIPTVPPQRYSAPDQGLRRDYGTQTSGNRTAFPLRNGDFAGRTAPVNPQQTPARPYERAPQNAQGGYGQFSGAVQRPPYNAQPTQYNGQGAQYGANPYGSQQSGYPQNNVCSQNGGYQQDGFRPQGNYPPQQPFNGQYGQERDFSYENVQAQPNDQKKKRGLFGFGKQKKEEFDPGNMGNVIITEPRTYDDVRVIIDGLRKRQAIIIDLSKVSDKDSQRILDFLSGAIYALGGAQQRINDHMFLFTPEGVMIQGPASLRNKYR